MVTFTTRVWQVIFASYTMSHQSSTAELMSPCISQEWCKIIYKSLLKRSDGMWMCWKEREKKERKTRTKIQEKKRMRKNAVSLGYRVFRGFSRFTCKRETDNETTMKTEKKIRGNKLTKQTQWSSHWIDVTIGDRKRYDERKRSSRIKRREKKRKAREKGAQQGRQSQRERQKDEHCSRMKKRRENSEARQVNVKKEHQFEWKSGSDLLLVSYSTSPKYLKQGMTASLRAGVDGQQDILSQNCGQ